MLRGTHKNTKFLFILKLSIRGKRGIRLTALTLPGVVGYTVERPKANGTLNGWYRAAMYLTVQSPAVLLLRWALGASGKLVSRSVGGDQGELPMSYG